MKIIKINKLVEMGRVIFIDLENGVEIQSEYTQDDLFALDEGKQATSITQYEDGFKINWE